MKKLQIIISFIILLVGNINSQSITTFRSNVYESYKTKFGTPEKIINTNTFYNNTSSETKKEIIEFSKNLDTITEKRFKNSKLDAALVFIFNDRYELIFRSFTRKIPLIGWQHETTTYHYDKTGLIKTITLHSSGNILNKTNIENDSLKNPISLKLYDQDDKFMGLETAEYNYSGNKWIYRVYDNQNNLMTEKELKIKPEKTESNKYNKFGDCTLYPRNWNVNDKTFYQVDYKYDKFGNWTQKKIYKLEKVSEGFRNKKIDRIFKRKIKYRKN